MRRNSLLLVLLIMALILAPMTAFASSVDINGITDVVTIKRTIESALAGANTVTVTGSVAPNGTLALNIPGGKTVIWQAIYTRAGTGSDAITLVRTGADRAGFNLATGGVVAVSGGGNAIDTTGGVDLVISGGTASTFTGRAVNIAPGATLTMSGGTIRADREGGRAIYLEQEGAVIVSGGEVVAVDNNGVAFAGIAGRTAVIKGSVTVRGSITCDLTVESDGTLIIPAGGTLTVDPSVTLTNNHGGRINNRGTIVNYGSIINNGAIIGNAITGNPSTGNAHDFIPVTRITGIPARIPLGTFTLAGTVVPSDAVHKTVTWSVKNAGNTGAQIAGNVLTTSETGNIVIVAAIPNGMTGSTPFTQEFPIQVDRIINLPVVGGDGDTKIQLPPGVEPDSDGKISLPAGDLNSAIVTTTTGMTLLLPGRTVIRTSHPDKGVAIVPTGALCTLTTSDENVSVSLTFSTGGNSVRIDEPDGKISLLSQTTITTFNDTAKITLRRGSIFENVESYGTARPNARETRTLSDRKFVFIEPREGGANTGSKRVASGGLLRVDRDGYVEIIRGEERSSSRGGGCSAGFGAIPLLLAGYALKPRKSRRE